MVDLSVTIPFYNEEKNAPILLKNIAKAFEDSKLNYEIVAIDNGSWDKTGEILRKESTKNKRIKVVTVKNNKGYGYGILQGLKECKGNIIGWMWADDSNGGEKIVNLYSKLNNSDSTLAKVVRIQRDETFFRIIQSKVYNSLFNIVFGLKSKDINGCPKLIKHNFYDSIKLKSYDWFLDPEIMIKLKKSKKDYIEIPVEPEKRVHGKSHVKLYTCLEFIKNMVRYKKEGY